LFPYFVIWIRYRAPGSRYQVEDPTDAGQVNAAGEDVLLDGPGEE
jgi:hypothetical protein